MSKFISISRFKWTDHKEFGSNRYSSKSSKGCALEVDIEFSKYQLKLNNEYPLATDKIEIKCLVIN